MAADVLLQDSDQWNGRIKKAKQASRGRKTVTHNMMLNVDRCGLLASRTADTAAAAAAVDAKYVYLNV